MLALLSTSCVHDKGQTAGEKNATWQEWTRAIFRLAGQTPAPELSPQRLFTWPTGERERERVDTVSLLLSALHLTISLSLPLSVFLMTKIKPKNNIPMLRKGHRYPTMLFITFHLFRSLPPLDALAGSAMLATSWGKFRSTAQCICTDYIFICLFFIFVLTEIK